MEKEFKLRAWKKEDLKSLVKYANNLSIAKNMTDMFPHPYSEADGMSFIEFATQPGSAHIFAIEVDGEAAGGIGIHPQHDIHRKNAELGYWLGEPFWGMGIISRPSGRPWILLSGIIMTSTVFLHARSAAIQHPRKSWKKRICTGSTF
uniref:GNAT family N-acetyltransferase n=1 Tax=Chryseobacterium endophyticum TaxID=1854762 RepID=A0AAU6WPQ2_9FLAO